MQTQTFDGRTGNPIDPPQDKASGKRRRIDLSNARDMRLEMAYLYRQCDAGKIESGEMNRRIWALGEMLKAYVVQDLERRLVDLEGGRQLLPDQA